MIKPLGIDPSFRGFGLSNGKEHTVIATKPRDDQTQCQNLQRRCQEIIAKSVIFINQNYNESDELLIVVEAPSYGSHGHLFEMGFLFAELYNRLPAMIDNKCTIIEVPPSTLKKFVTGSGKADDKEKSRMKASIKERWGVEFELDRGGNMADAFGLYKFGVAVLEGTIDYQRIPRRGKGKKRGSTSKRTSSPQSAKPRSNNARPARSDPKAPRDGVKRVRKVR